jgi:hypothetical protein
MVSNPSLYYIWFESVAIEGWVGRSRDGRKLKPFPACCVSLSLVAAGTGGLKEEPIENNRGHVHHGFATN